jgi:hypothetical protein
MIEVPIYLEALGRKAFTVGLLLTLPGCVKITETSHVPDVSQTGTPIPTLHTTLTETPNLAGTPMPTETIELFPTPTIYPTQEPLICVPNNRIDVELEECPGNQACMDDCGGIDCGSCTDGK